MSYIKSLFKYLILKSYIEGLFKSLILKNIIKISYIKSF